MPLLILLLVWAMVFFPNGVRYVRERRAQPSVRAFSRGAAQRARRPSVRYVFGAYEPYKDGNGWEAVDSLEKDISYLPPTARPVRARRYAYADHSYSDERAHAPSRIAYDDGYQDLDEYDSYGEEAEEIRTYGDAYRDELADIQALPRAAMTAVASPNHGAPRQDGRVALRRRRQIFFGLVLGFLASLGTAAWSGTMTAWGVHGVAVMLLAGYVSLLVHHHRRTVERSTKVHRLGPAPDARPVRRPTVVVLNGGTAP